VLRSTSTSHLSSDARDRQSIATCSPSTGASRYILPSGRAVEAVRE